MVILIIILTAIISIIALNNPLIMDKLRFNAYFIKHNKEWYRFFSYSLVHADYIHLFVNMYVLYSFGEIVLTLFKFYFGGKAIIYFLLLYIGGILFSTLVDFNKNKDNIYYNAVGASGAVSAIVFSSIILYPGGKLFLFFIPIGIPSAIFGILYLIYSAYMTKRANDNIGHSAHFWGAIFGVVFTIILKPKFALMFLEQLKSIF
ncbi:MAG: rhomboid family intramembrane serine protease [Bacteroidales bacterium]|nr:rhomboid family intramembrane serine protease [Bacteroidales bacterium]